MKKANRKNEMQTSGKPMPVPLSEYPRCAGVLLHITSLPSPFGIGDFGPQAYLFADFLQRSHQTIWQLLPINSSSQEQGFSPYGSNGSFAGNILLISPEQLVKDGLLEKEEVALHYIKGNTTTDYSKAQQAKNTLLDKAYISFKKQSSLHQLFASFCREESDWLNDYALYIILKIESQNKSWNEWKQEYKNREAKALQTFAEAHSEELEKVKWQQWIFYKQWRELKDYCNKINIKLFGDLPFYVAYDSADVWTHKHLFKLTANGKMMAEGGAPPDDFNADGQRWGMPVYNWEAIQKEKFVWWLRRMKKNIALYDLLRLDHFRGFSAYWEIKTNAKSAKEGAWMPVPGTAFFTKLQKEIGALPLVAEDLGSIDAPVLQLRDRFNIPGMIILQVAFGEDMPQSKSIPHHHSVNAVVYTGNHDNNTTLGWYESLPQKLAQNVSLYTNRSVTKETVCDVMIHLAYASVAKLAILPMQDILKLTAQARMNSVPDGGKSWSWQMPAASLTQKTEKQLCDLCYLYDRQLKEIK